MGKDKYENEDLIAYGWPEDVWYTLKGIRMIYRFHVDEVSSAHVYIRLNRVGNFMVSEFSRERQLMIFRKKLLRMFSNW